ncbi:hypothetical protein ED733_002528 [Metarhizium rileyi]|uniref:Heat-labile enterotoxin IIA, A chain n=1 Tax=Metarhizium rileyi (strain RCEF 4871) TaxID=1649241 RepID=A0A5C6G7F5_METRR|nr:hypothetical protein ED733_002528 [Metarhizium rileyi]
MTGYGPLTLLTLAIGLCSQVHATPIESVPSDAGHLQQREVPMPQILYRGDPRSPEEVAADGGFYPRSDVVPSSENNGFSLWLHHEDNRTTHPQRATAYVSTTRNFGIAVSYSDPRKTAGWVYEIQALPHLVDLDATLRQGMRWRIEEEFSALGGIPWTQVRRTMKIPGGRTSRFYSGQKGGNWTIVTQEMVQKKVPDAKWVDNVDYNSAFDQFKASPGQPQLAGWSGIREEFNSKQPWNAYNDKSTEQYFIEFMNEHGKQVGWTGTYPLRFPAKKTSTEQEQASSDKQKTSAEQNRAHSKTYCGRSGIDNNKCVRAAQRCDKYGSDQLETRKYLHCIDVMQVCDEKSSTADNTRNPKESQMYQCVSKLWEAVSQNKVSLGDLPKLSQLAEA